MIWFECKQCGKQMKQAENAAGSLVFCVCGQANRVPWESTLVSDAEQAEETEPLHLRPSRKVEIPQLDPEYCLNHQEVSSEHTCADCNERFCPTCVVTLGGQTYCGPCKNFRLATLQRPRSISGLAIGSLAVGLAGGPFGCCLSTLGLGSQDGPRALAAVFSLATMLLPAMAVVLGFLALREIERKPRVGGHAIAITGAVTGIIGVVASVTLTLVVMGKPLLE